ncbi:hypothetical protein V5799_026309 [Amblyomma americanum]|uniref:Uncharacterized protein n=1 Tax=Amblyomma americanum TaxID=6943 RepID=A0AAQ4DIY4_AMBAM
MKPRPPPKTRRDMITRLPDGEYKIVFRPRCPNIPGQVAAYNDDLRIHQGNNTFTVSTLDKTRARTYAALKSLSVGEEKYEMNAYETDEEIYAEFQKRNRNLNLVGGRQLGKSRHVSPDSRDAAAERDLIPGM